MPVTAPCKFGGFKIGDNKNNTITPNGNYINKFESGWRVLSKNEDGTINLVHAGTSEAYCQQYGTNCGYKNEFILSGAKNVNDNSDITEGIVPRDWSMYENNKYVVKNSARMLKKNEIEKFQKSNDIRSIGVYYWEEVAGTINMLWFLDPQGNSWCNQYWNACFGIRPVVTIKSEIKVDEGENNTHETNETAWKLIIE